MTEASHRLQQAKLLASMSNATRTLALQRAMWATKRQLQAQRPEGQLLPTSRAGQQGRTISCPTPRRTNRRSLSNG